MHRSLRRVATLTLVVSTLALTLAAGPDNSAIRVTAVVTNSRGEPIKDLRARDFQVVVDGSARAVDTIEFRKDSPTPRAFALLLDEFHVDAADSAAIREILTRFVESSMGADDVALVFKPLDPLTSIQPTKNRQAVRDAISSFTGRKGDFTPRTVFEQKYMAQAPDAIAAARAQIVSSALREVALRLGDLREIRPAVVLVSDGFARQRVDRTVPASLLSAVRIANRGEVPVYVFAPSTAPNPQAAGSEGEADAARAALEAVAAQTGGDFNGGIGTFAGGLTRMTRDLNAHYVLTYQAPHGEDGRFHSLQISLNRPDARVRARAGYVAPLSADLRAASFPVPAPARALKRSVLIQSWSGVTKAAEGKARVTFTWEPAPARPGAARAMPALLLLTASTPQGTVLYDGSIAAVGSPAPAGGTSRADFEAPPGRVLIDIKVLDAKGVVMDSDARDLDVPRLDSSRVTILPPAVLRIASAREFRAASEDPDAPPVATRDFRRTDRLLLRVPAYEPGGSPARVSATLLNRWRHPMRAIPAMSGSAGEGVTQFDIPLAPLAPGEYSIRLTAGSVTEHVTFRVRG